MKKEISLLIIFVLVFIAFPAVPAETCDISISMVNQDPYPAIPGDYVKLVFQVDGVDNSDCGKVQIELLEQYPLVFDPNFQSKYSIDSGTYNKDFSSFFLATYKVRVDEDALDGSNPIELIYKYKTGTTDFEQKFDLEVEDTKADFEVHVKDYDPVTKSLTFEILNIAKSDVYALTVEIPEQETIKVQGSKRNIVGDLDSNEYTTADFKAIPSEGKIKMKIYYTDEINERRVIEKSVFYEPEYFEYEKGNGTSFTTYLVWIIIIAAVGYYFYQRQKKKQKKKNRK